MTAQEFWKQCDGYDELTLQVKKLEKFKEIVEKVRVIARATPQDKLVLTKGFRQIHDSGVHKIVAVSGEGFADVPALEAANVGFSMGSGVPAAKYAANMILVNDNIKSIINAIVWGRNIYGNVRRFLQFQITFNITTLLIVFIGGIFRGATLFSVLQLLWINLIMDTIAAVALAAEKPQPDSIKEKPVNENDNLITNTMWK